MVQDAELIAQTAARALGLASSRAHFFRHTAGGSSRSFSDWANYDGPHPASNPKYCYNWSFEQPGAGSRRRGLAIIMQPDVQKASAAPALLTAWADGWSRPGEPERLLALFNAGMVYEDVAFGDVVQGTQAFRTLLGDVKQAIPDFRIQVFDGFSAENMATVEYEISGTQAGDLPYLKATGKSFRLRATSILALEDGKISRESRYYDMTRFLVQLGALAPAELPPLGTPAERPGDRS